MCDSEDNDCNSGTADGVDESWYGDACDGTDDDLCADGSYYCSSSGAQACNDSAGSIEEECNGIDDDCDGTVDEGCEDDDDTQDDDDDDTQDDDDEDYEAGPGACSDGEDNDNDGRTDCDDLACQVEDFCGDGGGGCGCSLGAAFPATDPRPASVITLFGLVCFSIRRRQRGDVVVGRGGTRMGRSRDSSTVWRAALLLLLPLITACGHFRTVTERVPYTDYEVRTEWVDREVEEEVVTRHPPTVDVEGATTVAVIPFLDAPGAAGSGLTFADRLEIGLVQRSSFTVVDRTRLYSVLGERAMSGLSIVDPELAQKLHDLLGVEVFLSGSLETYGTARLSTNVRITATSSGRLIWAQNYSGSLADVPTLVVRDLTGWEERSVVTRVKRVPVEERVPVTRYRMEERSEWVDTSGIAIAVGVSSGVGLLLTLVAFAALGSGV